MSVLAPFARHAHWALRLAILSVFLYHGLDKFGNLGGFAEMAGMPVAVAFLVALAEAGGALLVFAGGFLKDWMTRLGAVAIIPVMLGAIFMVHWGQWPFMATESHPMGGMEFQVTLLLILVYLALKGNGVNEEVGHS
ncbi:MAG: DoxX family protein [Gemmatimonadota bacterium]